MAEDYRERQEDELQVLQAIYMEDVEDLRKPAVWKVRPAPRLRLTLTPQQSSGPHGEIHTKVDMLVNCPDRYPEEIPEICLENSKGLSNKELDELKRDVEQLARSLKGEVMLLELAQTVEQYLHKHNRPPAKSFYEEMMSNKREQEEKLAQEQQKKLELLRKKEEKQRQLLEDEIERRKAALKVETRKLKVEHYQDMDTPSSSEPLTPSSADVISFSPIGTPGTPLRGTRVSVSPSPYIVQNNPETNSDQRPRRQRRTSTPHRNSGGDSTDQCKSHAGGVVVLAFNTKSDRTINRGTCLGHSNNGSTVYVGIDTQTGEMVAVVEWVLRWYTSSRRKIAVTKEEERDISQYTKQVMSIEQEVNSLIHLHHPSLLHYLAFKYQKDADKITVSVLMEYCTGLSVNTYIKRGQPLTIGLVKQYAEDLLYALEYIHSKDVVHKYLRPSSVFVDNLGKVRLSDYSIDKRLTDLFQLVETSRPGVHFTNHNAPPAGRGGKKGDILQLGLLLLSLARGEEVLTSTPDIPTGFPTDFQDFLTKCLLNDDRHRWAVHQLLEHPFIKLTIPLTIHYTQAKPQDRPQTTEDCPEADDQEEGEEEEEEEERPFITAFEASGQSRLTNEFDILRSLGKGGFGDVLKVKNKLDARMYAIKRIPLNPRSKLFNKKITREVKLLSRLNHENVVRYYNSWIETSEDPAESDSSSSNFSSSNPDQPPVTKPITQPPPFLHNTLNMTDDLEKFVPQAVEGSIEWSMSYDVAVTDAQESDSEDEMDVFGTSFLPKTDSSEDIVFEHSLENLFGEASSTSFEPSLSSNKLSQDADKKGETTDSEDLNVVPRLQYLYIQMEYCEKSTLRNCIDAGLYEDKDRAWRFFREIIEGLQHIHQQGMIHRDLKPVNIFLDSNDHVKIGDFGLATTNIILKQQGTLMDVSMLTANLGDSQYSSRSGSVGDGSLTGKVGTALYVSPEMMTGESRFIYSQKVDLYSMGIIFFEMCYKPLPTGMERVKILSNLRLPEINFPEDFDQVELENQTHILKWLLNHDPSKRPTSTELLQSSRLPPPKLEEAELNEVLRSTISNTNSKAFHRMLTTLFAQPFNSAVDVLYDTDYHKVALSLKTPLIQQLVRETLTRLFRKHGAVQLATPLLMPKCGVYEDNDAYTCVIDHSGQPVALPFDLRVPFARYIARGGVQYLKRFCIDRVFREKKMFQHPRELTECAFDIVTPNPGNLIPDAELLVLVQDIINEFQVLQARNYYVRINHVSILQAVLIHNRVPEDLRTDILRVLTGAKIESQNKAHIKALTNLGLSEATSSSILAALEMEGPYKKVASYLRMITKTKGLAATLAKQGVHEVEAIMGHADAMGLKLPIVFSLGCIYNTQQYSGAIFQIVYDSKKKKRTIPDLIAAGGRYNNLVKKFQSPLTSGLLNNPVHSVVGVSVAFEKLVIAVAENKEFHPPGPFDILVCTIGYMPMLKERMGVVKDLWGAGLRADILLDTLQSLEDIQEYCRSVGITYLVILKDADSSCVRVRSIERERVTEKKIIMSDLVDYLQPKNLTSKIDQNESQQAPSGKNSVYIYQPHFEQSQASTNLTLNFTFIQMEGGRLAANFRRKLEAQIFSRVSSSLSWVQTKSFEVVCVELTLSVLKVMTAFLDFDGTEKDFEDSVTSVMEKLQRHRKYLSKITDQLFQLKFEKMCSFVVLYGSKDDSLKLVM